MHLFSEMPGVLPASPCDDASRCLGVADPGILGFPRDSRWSKPYHQFDGERGYLDGPPTPRSALRQSTSIETETASPSHRRSSRNHIKSSAAHKLSRGFFRRHPHANENRPAAERRDPGRTRRAVETAPQDATNSREARRWNNKKPLAPGGFPLRRCMSRGGRVPSRVVVGWLGVRLVVRLVSPLQRLLHPRWGPSARRPASSSRTPASGAGPSAKAGISSVLVVHLGGILCVTCG